MPSALIFWKTSNHNEGTGSLQVMSPSHFTAKIGDAKVAMQSCNAPERMKLSTENHDALAVNEERLGVPRHLQRLASEILLDAKDNKNHTMFCKARRESCMTLSMMLKRSKDRGLTGAESSSAAAKRPTSVMTPKMILLYASAWIANFTR